MAHINFAASYFVAGCYVGALAMMCNGSLARLACVALLPTAPVVMMHARAVCNGRQSFLHTAWSAHQLYSTPGWVAAISLTFLGLGFDAADTSQAFSHFLGASACGIVLFAHWLAEHAESISEQKRDRGTVGNKAD